MSVRLNITVDRQVYLRLKKQLPPKRISAFINDAVRARLFPDRRTLDEAYKAARRERWRVRVGADWKATETEDWPD
jgi:hypothetical protein